MKHFFYLPSAIFQNPVLPCFTAFFSFFGCLWSSKWQSEICAITHIKHDMQTLNSE